MSFYYLFSPFLIELTILSNQGNQFSSVTQSCPTLCNPMNLRTPGLPVHHQLQEFTQTHVHWVNDAIEPFHSTSFPSHPALNLQLNQLYTSYGQSIEVSASTSVLPMCTHDWFSLGWTDWISSNTTVEKHQFFGVHLSL